MKSRRKLLSFITSISIMCTTMMFNIIPAHALPRASVTEGTYVFYSKLGGDMVMDVDNASTKSGANVQLWKYNGSTAQQFEVKKSGDWYIIKPVCSGLALDVQGGSKESGANVQQYTPNNTDSQKWQFYDAGNGYFYLRSKVGNKALDVRGGKKINGTNIQVYNPGNNNDAQQWKLKKVSVKSLADIAVKEIGYQGTQSNGRGKGDCSKYGKFTGADGRSWCASFVSWCVNQAGISTKIVPKTASCNTMKNNSSSYYKWSSNTLKNIKKNDVLFFSTGSQDSHHVGIVYSVSGSNITVIEGNTSDDRVKKNTYTVNASSGKITKGWNGHYFCGYISVN